MKKLSAIILTIAIIQNTSAQINGLGSIGAGFEENKAFAVQLTGGVNYLKNELVIGYTAFLHQEDAKYPKIIFVRYGLTIPVGAIEIVPLIGYSLHTATVYDKVTGEDDVVRTEKSYNLLYGLKIQKKIGLGGLFISAENSKLSYLIGGMFVKID